MMSNREVLRYEVLPRQHSKRRARIVMTTRPPRVSKQSARDFAERCVMEYRACGSFTAA
jgi:hypothetical protein